MYKRQLLSRGVPQIEVSFDIDANGILNVSAKDKATGREQSIVIRASSGLDDAEIERMVKDAEAHAEDDRKARELVEARNAADNLLHSTRKTLAEVGDDVDGDEKTRIEDAMKALEEALGGDDKADIEARTQALAEASHSLAEKLYAKTAGAADGAAQPGSDAGQGTSGRGDDDVVDAEFGEVKDDQK